MAVDNAAGKGADPAVHSPSRWTLLRRFLTLAALAFSLGGFSFYAAVVVPTGTRVLDATSQGFVTQQVTPILNAAAVVTAALLAWEAWARRSARFTYVLALLVSIILAATAALALLHPQLGVLLDRETMSVVDPPRFYQRHRMYLWISSLQWAAQLAALALLVPRWWAVAR